MKKRVSSSSATSLRSGYVSKGVSPEVKEQAATIAKKLREEGKPWKEVVEKVSSPSYSPSERTLKLHVAKVRDNQPLFKDEKDSGRPATLTAEQWEVVGGAILLEEKETDYAWTKDWIATNIGVDVSIPTISRHLKDLELSIQLTGGRPMPKGMTQDEYTRQYYEDVLELHRSGFFTGDPAKVWCTDFTSDSRRLERKTTLNLKGAPQKKFSGAKPKYTNTFMAACCMDGSQFPALMFTYNPELKEGSRRWDEVLEWCTAWDIDSSRIVYERSDKQYCAESQRMVAHFKHIYRPLLAGTNVLHDAGNAYKIDGEYVLADGAAALHTFAPAPHGELSVWDNRLFAIAKNWWRSERVKFCGEDFTKQSVYLLYCIDCLKKDHIIGCFRRNYVLDGRKLSLQAVADQLKKTNRTTIKNQARHYDYVSAYKSWLEEHGQEAVGEEFEALDCGLDGAYWK